MYVCLCDPDAYFSVFAQVLIFPGLISEAACVFPASAVTFNLRYEQKHKHLRQDLVTHSIRPKIQTPRGENKREIIVDT